VITILSVGVFFLLVVVVVTVAAAAAAAVEVMIFKLVLFQHISGMLIMVLAYGWSRLSKRSLSVSLCLQINSTFLGSTCSGQAHVCHLHYYLFAGEIFEISLCCLGKAASLVVFNKSINWPTNQSINQSINLLTVRQSVNWHSLTSPLFDSVLLVSEFSIKLIEFDCRASYATHCLP